MGVLITKIKNIVYALPSDMKEDMGYFIPRTFLTQSVQVKEMTQGFMYAAVRILRCLEGILAVFAL